MIGACIKMIGKGQQPFTSQISQKYELKEDTSSNCSNKQEKIPKAEHKEIDERVQKWQIQQKKGQFDEMMGQNGHQGEQNNWSEKSIQKLLKLYQRLGPKWTLISKYFENKHENIIKNKFYCTIRKFIRYISFVLKDRETKNRKQMKFDSVIRILEIRDSLPEQLKLFNFQIRNSLIKQIQYMISHQEHPHQLLQVIQTVNKFNLDTRNFKRNKSKKHSQKMSQFLVANYIDEEFEIQQCSHVSAMSPKQQESQKMLITDINEPNNFEDPQLCDIKTKVINFHAYQKDILDDLLSELDTPVQQFF